MFESPRGHIGDCTVEVLDSSALQSPDPPAITGAANGSRPEAIRRSEVAHPVVLSHDPEHDQDAEAGAQLTRSREGEQAMATILFAALELAPAAEAEAYLWARRQLCASK